MADDLIPLRNGKTVTLDEFLSWSAGKQSANLKAYRPIISDDTKKKISAALKGKKKTAEAIEKNRQAQRGKKLTEAHKKNIGEGGKGKVHTEESIANMTAAQRARVLSEEAKAKISAANKGKVRGPRSDEMKAKLSAAMKGKKMALRHAQVMTPKGVFPTRKDAAIAYNVIYQTFCHWLKKRPAEFYVIVDAKEKPTSA